MIEKPSLFQIFPSKRQIDKQDEIWSARKISLGREMYAREATEEEAGWKKWDNICT